MPLPPTPPKGSPGTIRCAAGTSKHSAPEEVCSAKARRVPASLLNTYSASGLAPALIIRMASSRPLTGTSGSSGPKISSPMTASPGAGRSSVGAKYRLAASRSPPWTTVLPSARAASRSKCRSLTIRP